MLLRRDSKQRAGIRVLDHPQRAVGALCHIADAFANCPALGGFGAAVAVEEARQAGWLEGERTQHVSFRAPKALVEAAMREAGATSPTELGVAALAMIAQPDPVAAYFKESYGRLGADFDLDY